MAFTSFRLPVRHPGEIEPADARGAVLQSTLEAFQPSAAEHRPICARGAVDRGAVRLANAPCRR
jgi:hypothetical protein